MTGYEVERQRWAERHIFDQLGNVGSEVGRTIASYRRQDNQRFEAALSRALDLFDATVQGLIGQDSPRLKEVLRSREAFLALFYDDRFEAEADQVEAYFMHFAVAARNRMMVA